METILDQIRTQKTKLVDFVKTKKQRLQDKTENYKLKKEYLKKDEDEFEEQSSDTLELSETVWCNKFWQQYAVFFNNQFALVDAKALYIQSNGEMYVHSSNNNPTLIGNIQDCLYLYDNVEERFIKPNLNKLCVLNGFKIDGIKLNDLEKEQLNNTFFIKILNDRKTATYKE